jgi:CubicO group peptidase (beta-lactamase class C family)
MWRGLGRDSRDVRRQAVTAILSDSPSRAPGQFIYSNAGYLVAAAMMEELTGENWETLMRRELFVPLGMSSAGFGAPQGDAPWPHRWSSGKLLLVSPDQPGADNPPSLGPAGTVHASMADWVKFLQVFLGDGPKGFLRAGTMQELLRSETNGSAAGWFVVERGWAGGLALNHRGSNTMNYAIVWLAPNRARGIVMATNGASPDAASILDQLSAWMVTQYIANPRR